MGTRAIRSTWGPGGNTVTRSSLGAIGNRIHQVQGRPRWRPVTTSMCGPAKVQIHQAQEKSKGDQSHQIQVKPRWGPESLGPDEVKVGTRDIRYK